MKKNTSPSKKPNRWGARKGGVTRFKIVKEPEVSLGTGKLLREICQKDERSVAAPNSVWHFQAGDTVHIARAMISGLGPSYRIMHTCVWLHADDVQVEEKVLNHAGNHVDNNDMARGHASRLGFGNSFTPSQKSVNLSKGRIEDKKPAAKILKKRTFSSTKKLTGNTVTSNPKGALRGRRNKHMDKKELRSVIETISPSNTIHITFLNDKAHLTGDYTVLKVRTGRGRGGSKIIDLVDAFKNTISTGTGDSDNILNVTVGGVRHGFEAAEQELASYPKNAEMAKELRRKFTSLLDAEGDYTIQVDSRMPELAGTWTVNRTAKVQGRVGQLKLLLENVAEGRKTELWSYRHSGAVNGVKIWASDGTELTISENPMEVDEDPSQFADEDGES